MRPFGSRGWLGGLLAWLFAPSLVLAAEPDGMAFFEQKIRPVLVKECYSCHSPEGKKIKGGLRLDTRAGVLEGGDSGPAVVPGKPEESLLLEALRHDGLAMPPKSKLPDAVVADFGRWIKMGAPDPRDGQAVPARPGIDLDAGRSFWAYRPPRRGMPPPVADAAWPRTDIDRFILAPLEARGLHPVRDADRATLARRLSYDLIGLPPTPEEIDAFVADPAPDAYERLVDRLLASPRFGERWGRHWLDVARFAESLTLRGHVLGSAWHYRDYVIDAFNADMPYDCFLREQIAGDLLPARDLPERRRQLVATTFLALGNTNLEEDDQNQLRMDVVDEQLDTVGKAFLAQTIGCARCHDHKFDPIPTRDYYALAGILRNVKTIAAEKDRCYWIELPLPISPEQEAANAAHAKALAALEARVKDERGRAAAQGKTLALGRGPVPLGELPGIVIDDTQAVKSGEWKESRSLTTYAGAGYITARGSGDAKSTALFQTHLPVDGRYKVWLAYPSAPNRPTAVPVTISSADGTQTVSVDMRAPPIEGRFVSLGEYRFEGQGPASVQIANTGTKGDVAVDAVLFIAAEPRRPVALEPPQDTQGETLDALADGLKRLRGDEPRRDMVIRVVEESKIGDAAVHVRGSAHNLGETVPRGFLQVAAPSSRSVPAMPDRESGRRELATWLAARDNPLTARVIVNRAWHWLFGTGIVRTVDNFGTTGEAPSHPDLLDDLAVRFMDDDRWSLKALVRRIVLSRVYQLAAAGDPRALAADPEGRLRWRMDRRRLDAECLRDAILSVSGALRTEMGGPSFPPTLASDFKFAPGDTQRRSVYEPVFRNALPSLFEAFDFADPSMVVGRRDTSTIAPQALFLMNHPFVLEQSRQAARRLRDESGLDDRGRIARAYRLALGRPPTPAELRISLDLTADARDVRPEEAWAILFQVLFSTLDFRYIH